MTTLQRFDYFYLYAHDNFLFNFYCFKGNTDTKRESEYIDIDIRQSNHSENITTANVTWRNEAWGTKVPEYFRLVQESHL